MTIWPEPNTSNWQDTVFSQISARKTPDVHLSPLMQPRPLCAPALPLYTFLHPLSTIVGWWQPYNMSYSYIIYNPSLKPIPLQYAPHISRYTIFLIIRMYYSHEWNTARLFVKKKAHGLDCYFELEMAEISVQFSSNRLQDWKIYEAERLFSSPLQLNNNICCHCSSVYWFSGVYI